MADTPLVGSRVVVRHDVDSRVRTERDAPLARRPSQVEVGRFVLTARVENAFNDGASELAGFRSRGRTVPVGGRVAFGP